MISSSLCLFSVQLCKDEPIFLTAPNAQLFFTLVHDLYWLGISAQQSAPGHVLQPRYEIQLRRHFLRVA